MDDKHIEVPGARDVESVLATDPIFRIFRLRLARPHILGVIIAILILLMIVFGPSTDSRFIYTDF